MHFVLYKDVSHHWRWTLYASNNRKVADGSEGYFNKQDAINGIVLVMGTNANTPIRER